MARLAILSDTDLASVLERAIGRRIPTVVTVRRQNRWVVFKARMLAHTGDVLWFTTPPAVENRPPEELLRRQVVGLSFREGNERYLFSGGVARFGTHVDEEGLEIGTFAVPYPKEVECLNRRAEPRVDVPDDRGARACVWPGGCGVPVRANCPDRPLWSGELINLSGGGFQMITDGSAAEFFEAGDVAGARLTLEGGEESILVDAFFRYGTPSGSHALLGFAFARLDHSEQGRRLRQIILDKIAQYEQDRAGG